MNTPHTPPPAACPALEWARRFLPDYFSDAPAAFHAELFADLDDSEKRFIARIAPRGHAKSTCASLAYPLYAICEQKRRNIVIVSQESSLATQFVRDIRTELESNPLILEHYGNLCPQSPLPATAESALIEAPDAISQNESKSKTKSSAAKQSEPSLAAPTAPKKPKKRPIKPPLSATADSPHNKAPDALSKNATKSKAKSTAAQRAERSLATPEAPPKPKKRLLKPPANRKSPASARSPMPSSSNPIPQPRTRRTKWSESKFTTSTGITVQAKGSGAAFRGIRVGPQRPDLIICDDIEKDDHVETPEGRRKLEHWLRRVVMPALAPAGRLFIVGSIIHHDSLLANLRSPARFPHWDYRVYRALECAPILTHSGMTEDLAYTALWPARWPVERLIDERLRIGTLAFEQEYQANPIDDSVRVFRPEWLKRYDPDELAALDAQQRLIPLICVDPATGSEDGDFFALWAGGIDRITGVIYTRELSIARIGFIEQMRRIIDAFERHHPVKIGIEINAYQAALKQALDDHSLRTRQYLPVVALRSAANKRARIAGCSVFYENGTFRLPPALDPEIESQFLHFPKTKHDDAPDVCAMAIELARSTRSAARIECLTLRSTNPFANADL